MPAGFKCEEHDNPADFFLDTISSSEALDCCESSSLYGMIKRYLSYANHPYNITDQQSKLAGEKKLTGYYKSSAEYRKLQQRITPILDCATVTEKQSAPTYATSFVWQVSLSLSPHCIIQ